MTRYQLLAYQIDKVPGREGGRGPDVSREGVQRDLLPIVEGTTCRRSRWPTSSRCAPPGRGARGADGGRADLCLNGSRCAARLALHLDWAEGELLLTTETGDRIQFRLPLADKLPAEPTANIFAVRSTRGEEVSAISNRVSLVPVEPPPTPSNLQVTATPDGVEIAWDAAGAEGFDVFRRDAQLRIYGEPVARVDADARKYRDKSARFGRRYIYTVRAVASVEPLVYSDQAGEREIEYEDRFPPPLPRNLVLLAERASIRLRWDASAADDVAGYIIYRREPGRSFHPITDQPVSGTEYLDRNLASGLTYGYRIRVVDHVGNESELSDPVETTAR